MHEYFTRVIIEHPPTQTDIDAVQSDIRKKGLLIVEETGSRIKKILATHGSQDITSPVNLDSGWVIGELPAFRFKPGVLWILREIAGWNSPFRNP